MHAAKICAVGYFGHKKFVGPIYHIAGTVGYGIRLQCCGSSHP